MEYRSLGPTGVMVSPLCLGAMNFGGPTDKPESFAIIGRALEAGINFIDTANVYNAGESERIVGEALKQDGRRRQVILATKVHGKMGDGPNEQGGSRYHILRACEESLGRLQTDYIDLYQLHRPPIAIPPDETLRAFDDLIRSGKVLYIGCSTHPAWMVMEALAVSDRYCLARYVSEQPPYNLLDRRIENELVPLCLKYGLAILPWSPIGGGILADRYPGGHDLPKDSRASRWGEKFTHRLNLAAVQVAKLVAAMARERNMTAAQLALLWVKDQPGVTSPIIGPRTLAHVAEVLPVLERRLDDADRPLFDALVHPGNAVADFHSTNEWMKARIR
jgi:aryl-alcohol dehydrogenase-like predicted oxidoreductase